MADLFKTVLTNLSEGVLITKPSSEIIWANPAFCAMTGYQLRELLGNKPSIFRGPDTTPADVERLWDTLRTTGAFHGQVLNRRADGSPIHCSLSIIRAEDTWDEVVFVCTFRDVSLDVELENRLRVLKKQAEWSRDVTIAALAALAEQRDPCTGAHLQRMEAYTRLMAEWLLERYPGRFPEWARDAETISRCATLHDIGKVGIPDAILMKPGRLDEAEQAKMKEHPRLGAQIISRVLECQPESPFLLVARDIVACHHEAWNGTGYPSGLAGDEIPLAAQITTVADIFDALTSVRPYKGAHSFEDASDWIRRERGRLVGPLAVDAFVARLEDIRQVHAELADAPSTEPIAPSSMTRPLPLDILDVPPAPLLGREAVLTALQEGLANPSGGEVVIRDADVVGRVYIYQRGVAWVHVSSSTEALTDILRRDEGVAQDDLKSIIDECKRSGLNFAETLVAMGIISRARLEAVMREFLKRRLTELLSLREAQAMFVPQARVYTTEWSFPLDALLERPPIQLAS